MNWSELSQFLPVGVVLLAALVVVLIDLYLKPADRYVLPWIGIAGCGSALVLTLIGETQALTLELDKLKEPVQVLAAKIEHTAPDSEESKLARQIAGILDKASINAKAKAKESAQALEATSALLKNLATIIEKARPTAEVLADIQKLKQRVDSARLLADDTGAAQEGTVPPPGFAAVGKYSGYHLKLGGAFVLDGFGFAIWAIACMAGALAMLSASPHAEESSLAAGEYYGLNLLAVAGMMLLAVSHDFLTLLISLEIMSIATYILTGSQRSATRSNEAALKYLVLGAFGTAFMLMGMAFFYGGTGSLSLDAISKATKGFNGTFVLLGMGMILIGALFKIGAAPFHFWIPDVYQGAPSPITGLMAVGVKAAAFAVVGRLCFETFTSSEFAELWLPALEVMAVLTMIAGNILAISQSSVKRMLAYSGIAHTGYLMLALLISPEKKDVSEHLYSISFYLLVYGVMTLGAFGVLNLQRKDGKPLEEMDDFKGLAKDHAGIAICMTVFMLSLAGMPPLGGFFAKFMIFKGAIKEGHVLAAVLGILTSVASLFYYLRVVVNMFMSPANEGDKGEEPAHCRYAWASNLLIYAAGIGTLILGLFPGWVM